MTIHANQGGIASAANPRNSVSSNPFASLGRQSVLASVLSDLAHVSDREPDSANVTCLLNEAQSLASVLADYTNTLFTAEGDKVDSAVYAQPKIDLPAALDLLAGVISVGAIAQNELSDQSFRRALAAQAIQRGRAAKVAAVVEGKDHE